MTSPTNSGIAPSVQPETTGGRGKSAAEWSIIQAIVSRDATLRPSDFRVLIDIAARVENPDRLVYVAQGEVGQATGLNRSTVNRAVARLVERGYLQSRPNHDRGGRLANTYFLADGAQVAQ